MLTKLPLLIVPAALVCVAAIALAAPKPAPPQKPKAVPLMTPLQATRQKHGKAWSTMPNMTQMPNAHITAAFVLTQSGHGLAMDTSGKIIGESELAQPSQIIWHDSPPSKAAPKH